MTISFFTDIVNHHQIYVADELYKLCKGNYYYIATKPLSQKLIDKGYPDLSDRPFVLKAWESESLKEKAYDLAINSDIAIFMGSSMEHYEIPRLKLNKLTFEYSERWLKRGLINILSPNLIKHQLMYYIYGRKAPLFMLCSSAYAVNDFYFLHSFKNRCFKWGYFPRISDININKILESKGNDKVKILWCSRFIGWKHPEIVIHLANRLRADHINFVIDMYGSGEMLHQIIKMIEDHNLNSYIKLKGNIPNENLLEQMRLHDIFLFTSDRNEGWGAVANEAMSNGCLLIASNEIGSVPYLVENGRNGFIYKSGNIDSLFEVTVNAISNSAIRNKNAFNAYNDIKNIWSPQNAALNLLKLINRLQLGIGDLPQEGPCSLSYPVKL